MEGAKNQLTAGRANVHGREVKGIGMIAPFLAAAM